MAGRGSDATSVTLCVGLLAARGHVAANGRFDLCSRTTDEAGNTQADTEVWNVGGFANNAIERVRALVVAG